MGSPKRKRRSKRMSPASAAAGGSPRAAAILPPLDIQQQTLHHHLTRRSAAARKASRVHTVPAMVLSGIAPKSTGIKHVGTRPHSASHSLNQEQGSHTEGSASGYPSAMVAGHKTPSSVILSPIHHHR